MVSFERDNGVDVFCVVSMDMNVELLEGVRVDLRQGWRVVGWRLLAKFGRVHLWVSLVVAQLIRPHPRRLTAFSSKSFI
jgi:hypothetical protein